jgi:hypothetical protein
LPEPMASAPTDSMATISGAVVGPRRRGRSKAPNFTYDGLVSVICLELDATEVRTRRRLETQWGGGVWVAAGDAA